MSSKGSHPEKKSASVWSLEKIQTEADFFSGLLSRLETLDIQDVYIHSVEVHLDVLPKLLGELKPPVLGVTVRDKPGYLLVINVQQCTVYNVQCTV